MAQFLNRALEHSCTYDRAVGYFRTSVLPIIGESLIQLAERGGRVRIIASPSLTQDDVEAIEAGRRIAAEVLSDRVMSDLDFHLQHEGSNVTVRVLATLFVHGALDVRLAFRPTSVGLYHEKLGILMDQYGNVLSFVGSANETAAAWSGASNFEALEVFGTWMSESDSNRAWRHQQYFEQLWCNDIDGVEVAVLPQDLHTSLASLTFESLESARNALLRSLPVPASRVAVVPRAHQLEAVANWEAAGFRGLFRHATGTGKTVTAILAMEQHLSAGKSAIVLVPSDLLRSQWASELSRLLPGTAVESRLSRLSISDRRQRIRAMTSPIESEGGRVIVSTMQSASQDWFSSSVHADGEVLLVADEVHQLGSRHLRKALAINAQKRLGLSATPVRYCDPEGTAVIFDFFGEIVPPIIDIADAIEMKLLTPYQYFVEFAELDEPELESYRDFTSRIGQIAAMLKQPAHRNDLKDRLKRLLIQRAAVAKKARSKPQIAASVISKRFRDDERWIVYCEDSEQMETVHRLLLDCGVPAMKYFSGDDLRSTALETFVKHGGVIVSIRCLDQGVDIPTVSHAMILASSQNPRQYIQRRGRVLRLAEGKNHAVIYDVLVLPEDQSGSFDSLLVAEAARAEEFASHAMNIDGLLALRRQLALSNPAVLSELLSFGEEIDGE